MNDLMPLPAGGPTAAFYNSWIDYLNPMPHLLLSMVQQIFHSITEFLYAMGMGTLDAWEGAWKLADFAQIFTQAGKQADQTGFHVAQWIPMFLTLGLILFALVMAIQLLMFVITSGKRGLEWPKGVIIIFLVIGFTPMLMSGGLQIAKSANDSIMQKNKQDPMVKILQHNSVDLKALAMDNFNVSADKLDTYRPLVREANLNGKTFVNNPVFDTDMANKENLKGLSDTQKKVFENKINFDKQSMTMPLDKGGWLTGGALGEAYPRVKVNWIGVMAAFIVFTISVFLAIVELLLRFYRLAYYSLTMLFFSFREATGKKAVQMMQLMEGSIVGAGLMPLAVILFFAFVQYGINITGNMNLSWWPYTVLVVAILLAGMKGLMSGFSLIDQWTGVPTGQASAAQSAIAAMMGAKAAGSAAKSIGRGAMTGAGASRDLLKQKLADARDDADKMSQKMRDDFDNGTNGFGHPFNTIDGKSPEDYMKQPARTDTDEGTNNQKDNDSPSAPNDNSNNEYDNDGGTSDNPDYGSGTENDTNDYQIPMPDDSDEPPYSDANTNLDTGVATRVPMPEDSDEPSYSDANTDPDNGGATRVPMPGINDDESFNDFGDSNEGAVKVPLPPLPSGSGTDANNNGLPDNGQSNMEDTPNPEGPNIPLPQTRSEPGQKLYRGPQPQGIPNNGTGQTKPAVPNSTNPNSGNTTLSNTKSTGIPSITKSPASPASTNTSTNVQQVPQPNPVLNPNEINIQDEDADTEEHFTDEELDELFPPIDLSGWINNKDND